MECPRQVPYFAYTWGNADRTVFDTSTLSPFFKFMLYSHLYAMRNHPEVQDFILNGVEFTKRYVEEQLSLLCQSAEVFSVTNYFKFDPGIEFYIDIATDVKDKLLESLKQSKVKYCTPEKPLNISFCRYKTEVIKERIVKDPRQAKVSGGKLL